MLTATASVFDRLRKLDLTASEQAQIEDTMA
jgi:hypothetical protein